MKIENIQNKQNFNGLYFKRVSPEVTDALKQSPVIQNLGKRYDVYIKQYKRKVKEDFGDVLEYGLNFKIAEIVPNLFNNKFRILAETTSEFALDLGLYKHPEEINKIITEDLVNEAEYIDTNYFKKAFNKII